VALPPVESPEAHDGLSESAVVLDVPLAYQRDRYDCGLGSLSMLFAYYDTPVEAGQAAAFRKKAEAEQGLTGADLKAFVKEHGYDAFLFHGTSDGEGVKSIRTHLDKRRPLLVALSRDGEQNHFILLIGYDPEKDLVLFHDPKRGGGVYPRWQFDRLWSAAKNFTLLALPAAKPAPAPQGA